MYNFIRLLYVKIKQTPYTDNHTKLLTRVVPSTNQSFVSSVLEKRGRTYRLKMVEKKIRELLSGIDISLYDTSTCRHCKILITMGSNWKHTKVINIKFVQRKDIRFQSQYKIEKWNNSLNKGNEQWLANEHGTEQFKDT